MKSKKNEHGYALLTVLLLVLLFTTLGMGLLAMNINASKQFNIKEESVEARHQAEMGVLHYQKELEKYILNNELVIDNAVAFCENVNPLKVEFGTIEKKYTTTLLKNECSIVDGKLVIPLDSVGTVGKNGSESIEAKLYLNNTSNVPLEPKPPALGVIRDKEPSCSHNGNGHDCNLVIEEFTNITSLTLKKGEVVFNDHLVVGNVTVNGGNGQQLTIKKDMYIKEKFSTTNFACVAVQGNLSILKEADFGNKTYIYVYGDVNLNEKPDFQNGNGGIFINGDVYLKGLRVDPKPEWAPSFPSHPHSIGDCKLPGKGDTSVKNWVLSDKIDADYK